MSRWTRLIALTLALSGFLTAPALGQPATYLPWQSGVTYRVMQGNGGGFSHNTVYTRYGWDFAISAGTPVLAAASGRVSKAGWDGSGFGNSVVVCYGDASCSRYAHLSRVAVRSSQTVEQAQLIGWVGSSGNSTGPHLHYQLEDGRGRAIASRFAEAGVPDSGSRVTSRNHGGTYAAALDAQFPMDRHGVVTIAQGDGAKVPIGYNLRNSGSRTWGDFRLVLVNNPPEELRRATGWETPQQIAGNHQTVAPGQSTFVRFHLNPSELNRPGDYPFQFRLVDRASGAVIPGVNPSFVLRIQAGRYAAAVVEQSYPALTEPGQTGRFEVVLKNTGTTTWRRDEVRLGTLRDEPFPYADGSWLNRNRVLMAENQVAPGGLAHFRANVAPAIGTAAALRRQYFAPVADGQQWFGQSLGIWLPIYVGNAERPPFAAADYQAKWLRQTYVGRPLRHGETATLSVTYRNEGPAVLFAGGSRPVNLRGCRDRDRASGFIDPAGSGVVGRGQGVKLGTRRVDPGEEFTFTLPVKVGGAVPPGDYREYFCLVAEGLAWFGPEDVWWPFTVAATPPATAAPAPSGASAPPAQPTAEEAPGTEAPEDQPDPPAPVDPPDSGPNDPAPEPPPAPPAADQPDTEPDDQPESDTQPDRAEPPESADQPSDSPPADSTTG